MQIHYINNFVSLADGLAEQLSRKTTTPLVPLNLVVPNMFVEQWLSDALSQRLSVLANTKRLHQSTLIDTLSQLLKVPKSTNYSVPILRWRIFDYLNRIDEKKLTDYCQRGGDVQEQCWLLSSELAALFDGYQKERVDWLLCWQKGNRLGLGDDEAWQQKLWQHLVEHEQDSVPLFVQMQQLNQKMSQLTKAQQNALVANFGNTLLVVAEANMEKDVLNVLNQLSQSLEVVLFVFNPSQEYWSDRVRQSRLNQFTDNPEQHIYLNNPILTAWGSETALFVEQLIELGADDNAVSDEPIGDAVLAQLQRSIMADTAIDEPFAPDDSLQLIRAQSAYDELQVARIKVSAFLTENPHCALHDCAIVLANVEQYAPLIPAVFHDVEYSINQQAYDEESLHFMTLLQLLKTPAGRFNDWELWLLNPLLEQQTKCSNSVLKLLLQQLFELGVRSGVNTLQDAHGLSWRQGLSSLYAGLLTQERQPIADNIMALPENVNDFENIQYLSIFIQKLIQWVEQSNQPKSLSDWQSSLLTLVKTVYGEDKILVESFTATIDQWSSSFPSNLALPLISWECVVNGLADFIKQKPQFRANSGRLAFVDLSNVQGIPRPFQMVLGIGSTALRTTRHAKQFDLRRHHPRMTDAAKNHSAESCLLQVLCATQNQLILSYAEDKINLIMHPLLQIMPPQWLQLSQDKSVNSQTNVGANASIDETVVKSETIEEPTVIPEVTDEENPLQLNQSLFPLEGLVRFWQNPLRSYFINQGIQIPWSKERQVEHYLWESMYDSQWLREALDLLQQFPKDAAMKSLNAMFHPVDKMVVENRMAEIVAKLGQLDTVKPSPLERLWLDDQVCLYAQDQLLQDGQPMMLVMKEPHARQKTQAWIWHLFCCAQGKNTDFVIESITQSPLRLNAIPQQDAKEQLQHLFELSQTGLNEAMPYFPDTCFKWAKQKPENKHIVPNDFFVRSTDKGFGDLDDPYNALWYASKKSLDAKAIKAEVLKHIECYTPLIVQPFLDAQS